MALSEILVIRDAVDSDLPSIVEIYNAAIPGRLATADTEPVSVTSREAWFRDHGPRRPLWVACRDDVIVGWLSVQSFYGRPAYHATAELSTYVDRASRHAGVGRALLARAVAHAPHLGLKTLLAFVFAHNEASLRLFAGFGFERWGALRRIAELDGIERDVFILGLRIAP
jgi:L-amino acid N-acyltransferase YncA